MKFRRNSGNHFAFVAIFSKALYDKRFIPLQYALIKEYKRKVVKLPFVLKKYFLD
jgi:hypothetical protein